MPDDTPFTDAPDVSKDFLETQPERESSESKDLSSGQTVSKIEKEMLEKERTAPVVEQTLTIGGHRETNVHRDAEQSKEDRIAQIEQRLNNRKNQAKKSFNRSL